MHQSSTPSTPTNTGAARIAIVTYRSWIRWPCTVVPWPAHPVSNVPARAASPTRETLEAAIRIGWSGDRELEGHADGGVHRPLTTADLALGLPRRQREQHELVGDRARLAVGQGDDRLAGLDARRHPAVLELLHRDLVDGEPGVARCRPLRLALAAPGQRQRHRPQAQYGEPPWP